ncbi:MAG TPA: hypothetical protein VHS28_10280 [Chloroflexota bacterium]|nr:hypothetical protein [Chloroflexota bacterium]
MLQRIDSSRERLEEMAGAERRPPILFLLMGLIPAIVIAAALLFTGIIPTPLKDGKAAALAQSVIRPNDSGKNRATHTVQDWAQQLAAGITRVQEDTQRIHSQLQRSQDALQAEKADLSSLQSMLDGVRKDAASRQLGNLEVRKGGLELRYQAWQQSRTEFQDSLNQLRSSLAQVDGEISSVQQIASELDKARWEDPLAAPPSPAPGDEQPPLQQYRAAADAVSKVLPSLEENDAGYQKAADAAIGEARAMGAPPAKPQEIGAAAGFIGGFADLAGRIPDVVGKPTEPEHKDPNSGDTVQHTTRGMMVWRKADNWIVFTDGSRTWLMGPQGLQVRDNNQQFSWEKKAGN